MRALAGFFISAAIAGIAISDPAPKMLIVPLKRSTVSQVPSLAIGNYLAQDLDQDGRVDPIVWSMTDPSFRQVATSGQMGSVPDYPTEEKAIAGAHKISAPYVLFYSSIPTAKGIEARAELFEGKKEIWHDVQTMGSHESGGLSGEDTNRSIAHTWALLLYASSFKTLATRPKAVTPAIPKGQEPAQVAVTPPPVVDNYAAIETKVDEYKKAGKVQQAITFTRDAIDANPFDAKLRLLVVTLYEGEKNWTAAADAARRGSEVIPDNVELRQASVRDLLASGNSKEVKDQLNEIVARDPNSKNSLMIQSQTYMVVGDYGKAAEVLDGMVKKFPEPEAYYWRALCRATLGGTDGVGSDVQEYLKAPILGARALQFGEDSERIIQAATQKDIDTTLQVYQQAGVNPNSPAVKDQLDQLQRDATARAAFLQQIQAPASLHESYGALLLAQKLLLVSYISMRDVVKTASDDSMVDARINLGDAIKSLKSSKQKLAAELGESSFVGRSLDLS